MKDYCKFYSAEGNGPTDQDKIEMTIADNQERDPIIEMDTDSEKSVSATETRKSVFMKPWSKYLIIGLVILLIAETITLVIVLASPEKEGIPGSGPRSVPPSKNLAFTNNYTCDCESRFNGTENGNKTDECKSNPCKQGTCADDVNGYNRTCIDGYTGINCEEENDGCKSNPCKHGICAVGVNGYICICINGYTGINCEEEIDECKSNPCKEGTCVDGINGYKCTCIDGYTGIQCQHALYYGTSFITGFMKNYNKAENPWLFIASASGHDVNVTVSIPRLSVYDHYTSSDELTLAYHESIADIPAAEISKNAILVTSDYPIMLYTVNVRDSGRSGDGSFILPIPSLGSEYIIASYPSTSHNNQFVIISPSNNTDILLDFRNGSQGSFTMNTFDIYRCEDKNLTGTIVKTSSPVLVISGHICANIPTNYDRYCDYIDEIMPPITSLGIVHVVSCMHPRSDFSIGVVAPRNHTSVTVYDSLGNVLETVPNMMSKDAFFRQYFDVTISLVSNLPVQVTQYGHGSNGKLGDPSMMLIPPVNAFGNEYYFSVPNRSTFPSPPATLQIVISAIYNASGLLLNQVALKIKKSITVRVPDNGFYHVLYADVPGGYNTISHLDGTTASFGAWLYDRSSRSEYAWSLGMNTLVTE